jgi:hypothetical protein
MKTFMNILSIGIFCLAAAIAQAAEPAKDLIIHLSFDEGNGNKANDASPNKFSGDIKNAKAVDGVVGKALDFDNGAVTVDALKVDDPKELTIEFWFKPAKKIEGGNRIDLMYRLRGGGRPHITFNRGGVLFGFYFATQAAELEVQSKFEAWEAKWYYFVATQDKDKAIIYIDGEVDNESKSGGAVRFDYIVEGVSIGASQGNENFYTGMMDEVKIWSVALTADEVKKSMAAALSVEADGKLATTWGDIKGF